MISDSLLASASVVPASSAASVGRSPTAPVMPLSTTSQGLRGRLGRRVLAEAAERGAELVDLGAEQVGVAAARGQADDPEPVGVAADEVERLGADRAGRPEDDHVAPHPVILAVRSRPSS